MKYMFYKF